MRAPMYIDFNNSKIVMTRQFAQKAANTDNKEYKQLCEALNNFPNYKTEVRSIKKCAGKETYAGLTYDYMRRYITVHEPADSINEALHELEELICISKCHAKGKRYPTIKSWFLKKYPEVAKFGMPSDEAEAVEAACCIELNSTGGDKPAA